MPHTVSVFITSYNHRGYLAEAIDSVLAQTRPPEQIVIVDDASSDGSQQLIQDYASRYPGRIDYAFHTINQGVSATKTHGASLCTGHWITYLDGDDRMLPKRLETELALVGDSRGHVIVFSNFRTITPTGEALINWAEGNEVPVGQVLAPLLARNYPRGMIYRNELMPRHLFEAIGGYDRSINLYEDWELRIRLVEAGAETIYCPNLGSEYRLHPGGVSRQDPKRHLAAVTHIREKHQGLISRLNRPERLAAERCFDKLEQVFAARAAQGSIRKLQFRDAVAYGWQAWSRRVA